MMLIYKAVPDQESVAMTMNRTSIDPPVPQQPKGNRPLEGWDLILMILIYIATIVTGRVLLGALSTIQDKLLANLKQSGGGLEEEAGREKAFRRVMYISTTLSLTIMLVFGSFAFGELLSWAPWKD